MTTAAPARTTVGSGPTRRDREWTTPATPAPRRVLVGVALAALAAAVLVPLEKVGIGWSLAAVVVAAAVLALGSHRSTAADPIDGSERDRPARGRVRLPWLALGVALAASGAVRDAAWLFALCAIASVVCVSLAVSGGRSGRGLARGAVAVWSAGLLALPWMGAGARDAAQRPGGARVGAAVLVGIVLVVVFGALFVSADAAFAEVVSRVLPRVDSGSVIVFGAVGLLVGGAAFLVAAPLTAEKPLRAKAVRLVEWALPVGVLLALFAAFIAVQVAVLFGGADHVSRTGVTYAEYARSGFWQLLVVTGLTLGVIAGAARVAPVETAPQRAWLRGLLGGLAVATLVVVASALDRLWLYQETYGFTVLRLLVGVAELWLGAVCLMVLAAGVALRAGWLPRAALASGLGALLALAIVNPEGFIAQWNVERHAETRRIDVAYLGRLSADAVPALAALPEPVRGCVLAPHAVRSQQDGPLEWNWARSQAAPILARAGSCAEFTG